MFVYPCYCLLSPDFYILRMNTLFLFFFLKLKLTGIRITFTLNFEDFAILIVFFFRYLRRNDNLRSKQLCFVSFQK